MKKIINIIGIFAFVFLNACGDPSIDINEVEYQPKIVVEAFLYPDSPIDEIKLMRNFALETSIDSLDLLLTPTKNAVTASINDVPLNYNSTTGFFYNSNFIIEYGKTYKLKVTATIDGKTLYTESETLTPNSGFNIVNKDLGTIKYRQNKPTINFVPSPGTGFYAFSIRANNPTTDNFIYDNPYFPDLELKDLEESFNDFVFQLSVLLNVNSTKPDPLEYKIKELDTWFFTNYSVIVYGGDENFKDYLLTVNRVKQPDGNFVEPEFHFTGDGIGVFGSSVRDTVYFNLIK